MGQENPFMTPANLPAAKTKTNPKDRGTWRVLADFSKSKGFDYGHGFATSGHNEGSMHYTGEALDVRIRGKSTAEIEAFMRDAAAAGFNVRDERKWPAGQKKWGGPHIHLSMRLDGKSEANPFMHPENLPGGKQSAAPKRNQYYGSQDMKPESLLGAKASGSATQKDNRGYGSQDMESNDPFGGSKVAGSVYRKGQQPQGKGKGFDQRNALDLGAPPLKGFMGAAKGEVQNPDPFASERRERQHQANPKTKVKAKEANAAIARARFFAQQVDPPEIIKKDLARGTVTSETDLQRIHKFNAYADSIISGNTLDIGATINANRSPEEREERRITSEIAGRAQEGFKKGPDMIASGIRRMVDLPSHVGKAIIMFGDPSGATVRTYRDEKQFEEVATHLGNWALGALGLTGTKSAHIVGKLFDAQMLGNVGAELTQPNPNPANVAANLIFPLLNSGAGRTALAKALATYKGPEKGALNRLDLRAKTPTVTTTPDPVETLVWNVGRRLGLTDEQVAAHIQDAKGLTPKPQAPAPAPKAKKPQSGGFARLIKGMERDDVKQLLSENGLELGDDDSLFWIDKRGDKSKLRHNKNDFIDWVLGNKAGDDPLTYSDDEVWNSLVNRARSIITGEKQVALLPKVTRPDVPEEVITHDALGFTPDSPMLEQYAKAKAEHPNTILLMRVGDFYEAYGIDAEILAKNLGITLTKRGDVPMSGVPYHSVERHLATLMKKGHRVALADHLEDPKLAQGLVKRGVTRVEEPEVTATKRTGSNSVENVFLNSEEYFDGLRDQYDGVAKQVIQRYGDTPKAAQALDYLISKDIDDVAQASRILDHLDKPPTPVRLRSRGHSEYAGGTDQKPWNWVPASGRENVHPEFERWADRLDDLERDAYDKIRAKRVTPDGEPVKAPEPTAEPVKSEPAKTVAPEPPKVAASRTPEKRPITSDDLQDLSSRLDSDVRDSYPWVIDEADAAIAAHPSWARLKPYIEKFIKREHSTGGFEKSGHLETMRPYQWLDRDFSYEHLPKTQAETMAKLQARIKRELNMPKPDVWGLVQRQAQIEAPKVVAAPKPKVSTRRGRTPQNTTPRVANPTGKSTYTGPPRGYEPGATADEGIKHFKDHFKFSPELEAWGREGKPDANGFRPNQKAYLAERLRLALQDHFNMADLQGGIPTISVPGDGTFKLTKDGAAYMYRKLVGQDAIIEVGGQKVSVKSPKSTTMHPDSSPSQPRMKVFSVEGPPLAPLEGNPKQLPPWYKAGVTLAKEHHDGVPAADAAPKVTTAPKPKAKPKTDEPEGLSEPDGFDDSGFDAPDDIDMPDGVDMPKVKPTKRIEAAPLPGGNAKSLSDITLDFTKLIGRKIFYGKSAPRSLGTYYPGSAASVVRFTGSISTTAHELAHALDDKFGIVSRWADKRVKSPFDAELRKDIFQQTTRPSYSLMMKRAEGVAEYFRGWVLNPDLTESLAPEFTKYWKGLLPKNVQDALKSYSDDIRRHAGSSAHNQIMANTRWKPPDKGFIQWLKNGRSGEGPGFNVTWADRVQSAVQDHLKPFTKAIDYVKGQKGIDDMLPADDPEVLARLYSGVHGKMDDIFEHGMVDGKGNRVTGGGIKWLMEPLDNSSAKALTNELQEVSSYMIAQRTLEKGRTGIGAGLKKDSDVALARIADVAKDPAKQKRFDQAVERYREWADSTLLYLVDRGRLSRKQYNAIKANNEYYVAMQRVMEISPGEEMVMMRGKSGGLGASTKVVHRFKGSSRAIENPFTSLMDSTYTAIREGDRNAVMREFRDLLTNRRGMYQGEALDLSSVGRRAKSGEKDTMTIFVDGKGEVWQFHAEVYASLKGLEKGLFRLPPLITILPSVLRSTIVNLPPFAFRNWIRDSIHRSVITETGSKILDSAKRWGPMDVENLRKHGGDQAGHYMKDRVNYHRAMETAIKELASDKHSVLADPRKFGRTVTTGYKNVIQSSERAGRLAEYRSAYKHAIDKLGHDSYNAHLYAASKSRDLLDFAIAGSYMNVFNQLMPFTNAAVQGLVRTARSAKKNPKAFAMRWALNVVTPTVAVWTWNKMRGASEEYEQLPAYQRDLFWNLKMDDDLWLRIPKPFELGVLASGIDRALSKAAGDEHAFDGYKKSIWKSTFPIDESDMAGPIAGAVQAIANYDFFREKPMVPHYENNLDLDLRKTTGRASRLGQAMQALVGLDARKVDFLARAQLGILGDLTTKASDIGREDRRSLSPLDAFGVNSQSPVYAARDVQWVLEKARERGLAESHTKRLNTILDRYFDAKTAEQKDSFGREARKEGSRLRKIWERRLPGD